MVFRLAAFRFKGQNIVFPNLDIALTDVEGYTADSIGKFALHNQHIAGNYGEIITNGPLFQLQVIPGIVKLDDIFSVGLCQVDGLTVTHQLNIFSGGGIVEGIPIVTIGYIVGCQREIHTLVVAGIPAVGMAAHGAGLDGIIHIFLIGEGQAVVFSNGNDGATDRKGHAVCSILELSLHHQHVTGHDGEIIADGPGAQLQVVLCIGVLDDGASAGNADIVGLALPDQLQGGCGNRLVFHVPAVVRHFVSCQCKVQTVTACGVEAVSVGLHITTLDHGCIIRGEDRLTVFNGHISLFNVQHHIVGGIDKAALHDQDIALYNGLLTDRPEFQIVVGFAVLDQHFRTGIGNIIGHTVTNQPHRIGSSRYITKAPIGSIGRIVGIQFEP